MRKNLYFQKPCQGFVKTKNKQKTLERRIVVLALRNKSWVEIWKDQEWRSKLWNFLELLLKLRQHTEHSNEHEYLGAWDMLKRLKIGGRKIHCIAYSAKQKLREEESRNSSKATTNYSHILYLHGLVRRAASGN